MADPQLDFAELWEIFVSCDSSYDHLFYAAVTTTKIYCRPSCKSRKPKQTNVRFYRTRAQAEQAGFRACKRCRPDCDLSPQLELVTDALEYLMKHYRQKLVLQDIAEAVGVSPYHLERLFKQTTSLTPRQHLEKIRVDKAAYLLKKSKRSNLQICYEVGFQSPSNFYKAFRRLKQCSPAAYRKEHAEREEVVGG
ncbi:bifunctional transcriptional activator/DNA repair enzyme AdaA [Brevibacillus fulvus]|uniref:AraC family transcriptional regulator of adaptative response / methylphosphotriester-DNA alkyltransferase methyltransferase n=1 Tax=Brevibacillus fulvus TaxID=1125967 RepID=A0A939BQ12_9BACL|nr:Ada metal-binding domain-containing protein [Brevibacillus fulvus]MBM7591120.1 AraC family transcriptional regulator of adaptative response / methylphosphotriester-DNA alkyltransferase methyltransferase [Brevibacillus fulvus]